MNFIYLNARSRTLLLSAGLAFGWACPLTVSAEVAVSNSDRPGTVRPTADEDQLRADLVGGDSDRVRQAIERVRVRAARSSSHRAASLMLLVDTGRYADADAAARELLRCDPSSATIGQAQWVRVQVRIAQRHWPEALSAARSYYECCDLAETPDAIGLIAICLRQLHRNEPDIARFFEQQQIASANGSVGIGMPALMHSGTKSSDAAACSSESESLLGSIPLDRPTVADATDAADAIDPTDFRSSVRKANLLLLAGSPRDARALFASAGTFAARQQDFAEAYIGQARAIRAENGSLGPANAFIVSLQRENK